MTLVEQWQEIESGLEPGWGDARLRLTLAEPVHASRAAALLGPLNAHRSGTELRFHTVGRGSGPRPDAIRRALERLERERIDGTLELVAVDAGPRSPARRGRCSRRSGTRSARPCRPTGATSTSSSSSTRATTSPAPRST